MKISQNILVLAGSIYILLILGSGEFNFSLKSLRYIYIYLFILPVRSVIFAIAGLTKDFSVRRIAACHTDEQRNL